ncbi:MAG: autotransporter domain-containing protein [Devosia sp.]|nr:autotransporter domain-containing protein [Devosia sp.]
MLGLAIGAVMAGTDSTLAAGETFVWNGLGNGTSFAAESNWTDITAKRWVPVFDEDGYEIHIWLPVLDEDGNPVHALDQVFDEDGNPVVDEEGNEVWVEGEPLLEAGPIVLEERDVVLPGPPDGEQNMLLEAGTPNISSSGRHINDATLLGGEFLIRTGSVAVIPGNFYVDGLLTVGNEGVLTISQDDRGKSFLAARHAVIEGGTVRGAGILRVTGENSLTHEYDPTMGLTQSGGLITELNIETPIYTMSGGTLSALVDFETVFALSGTGEVTASAVLTGSDGAVMTQSGGSMAGSVTGIDSYTQSGGLFTGTMEVETYALTGDGTAVVGGEITASEAFNLGPATGTTTVDALLTGTGAVVKTGDSRVILTNGENAFTGSVTVSAGVLEVIDTALPNAASVDVAGGATVQFTVGATSDVTFDGVMTGAKGTLVKDGLGRLILTGDIEMGALDINAGALSIGNGITTETASFDSAVIQKDASLYIASGATLHIRVPNNLANYGTLVNDGTVIDDLDNSGTFTNNKDYIADVASNTGTIDNRQPGKWTGNIESNAGRIVNHEGATWTGAVEGNTGAITNDGTWIDGTVTNGQSGVKATLDFGKMIYNNYTGTWTGNIAANHGWILNAGGTWTGDVLSNNGEVWNDNWAGETGTGYWIGDVVDNHSSVFNGGGGDWTGDVLGNHGHLKNDPLAFWHGDIYSNDKAVESYGTWQGDVVGNARAIWNGGVWDGDIVAAGTITSMATGNIANTGNAGRIYNIGGTWTGIVEGNTGTISNAPGEVNAVMSGPSTWVGDVVSNDGMIFNAAGSNWTGDVLANAGSITTTSLWTGNITSSGRLAAGGSITGAVVNTGVLELVGDLTVGSVSFGGDAFFDVDLEAAGVGEMLTSTGAAALDGTVRVTAGSTMTSGDYLTSYDILTASAITGEFDGVTTDLAFLAPTLSYTLTTASVTLQRNTQEFSAVGVTPNQQAVANQIENELGEGNALYGAVLWLTPEEAQSAFDQLSGEVYASAEAAAAGKAMVVGDIALDRVDKAFDSIDARGSASGYAASSADLADGSGSTALWTQFYGAFDNADGDNGTSATDSSISGVALGLDGLLGDWRLGMMLNAGTGDTNIAALGSTVTDTSYGFGVYGGTNWGDTRLALAGTYARQDNASTRTVAFGNFTEELSADYASTTMLASARLSHEFDFGAVSLIPYASAAYVDHQTDGFSETGGAAALTSGGSLSATTIGAIGATVSYQMLLEDGVLVTTTASLGWQHSFAEGGDTSLALAGGTPITVSGTSPDSDVAAIAAGVNFDLNDTTALDLAYDGQIGAGSQTHVVSGTWATKF